MPLGLWILRIVLICERNSDQAWCLPSPLTVGRAFPCDVRGAICHGNIGLVRRMITYDGLGILITYDGLGILVVININLWDGHR